MSKKNQIVSLVVASFCLLAFPLFAGEGMWLPHLLKALNEEEMHAMGMKINAEDIYSINHGSLKDAIVHFGGGCTGSIISSKGLLLTNHHCGYSFVQSHSTVDNNILKNGFWAQSFEQELSNPGLTATFIREIVDVTDNVLGDIPDSLTSKERQKMILANIAKTKADIRLEPFEKIVIKPFYKGLQYIAFITVTYKDVRLVGVPPESIGKFGGDTDNWAWPRHTGDFSIFRIYVDKDNHPAEYNIDNVPLKPIHHLPVSLDGAAEGDFTLVFGFPGRTNAYLPSIAVKQIIEDFDPAKIAIREQSLGVMKKYMVQSEALKLKYASRFARIANYWKKWIGEREGLIKTDALNHKRALEKRFLDRIDSVAIWKEKYGMVYRAFNDAYTINRDYQLSREIHYEAFAWNSQLMRFMHSIHRLASFERDPNAFNSYKQKIDDRVKGFYDAFDHDIDREIFAKVIAEYFKYMPQHMVSPKMFAKWNELGQSGEKMAAFFYDHSIIADSSAFLRLWKLPKDSLMSALHSDEGFNIINDHISYFYDYIEPGYNDNKLVIDSLQKIYMEGLMTVFPKKRFFPDANSTLRVSYGKVEGYTPNDSTTYTPFTYLNGVIAKYKPGDYEFDLPPKLLELYKNKDYGQYADRKGRLPVCFLGSNHTTGGNSGSPVIDGWGNLIGLNFDRVWEGTMSDYYYDIRLCRNIMVDTRYVLFLIDKLGDCHRLIQEMDLVQPKTESKVKE